MNQSAETHVRIRTSRVVAGSLLLAVGSVTTLGVVLLIRNADVLASIALVLAIISFVVQLLFYVVQTDGAAQQVRAAERTNIETREVLAEIRIRTSSLETTVGGQMSKVWEWLIANQPATAKAASESLGPETKVRRTTTRRTPRPVTPEPEPEAQVEYFGNYPDRRPDDVRVLQELRTPPDAQELERARVVGESLNPTQRQALMHRIQDEVDSRRRNGSLGLPGPDPSGLDELGLVEASKSPYPDLSEDWSVLTDLGRLVGRYGRANEWAQIDDAPVPGEPPAE